MSGTIRSPARSQGSLTPRRLSRRLSHNSVGGSSPARSLRLSTILQQAKDAELSASDSRRSVLSDNTDIIEPRRKSWWNNLDDNSRDTMSLFENHDMQPENDVIEEYDETVMESQDRQDTLDLPESSGSESICSIILPEKRLFTKAKEQQKKFDKLIDKNELQKTIDLEKTVAIDVLPKKLFQKSQKRSRPNFPEALLNISDVLNKTAVDKTIEIREPIKNLFKKSGTVKRKNMFSEFIVTDNEEEISDVEVQPKVFGFQKNAKVCDVLDAITTTEQEVSIVKKNATQVYGGLEVIPSNEEEISDIEVQTKVFGFQKNAKVCDVLEAIPSNKDKISDVEVQPKACTVLEAITSNEEEISKIEVQPKVCELLEAIPSNEEEVSDVDLQPKDSVVLKAVSSNEANICDMVVQPKDCNVLEEEKISDVEVPPKDCDMLEEEPISDAEVQRKDESDVLEAIPANEGDISDVEMQPEDCDISETVSSNEDPSSDVEEQSKDFDVLEEKETSDVEMQSKDCDVLEEDTSDVEEQSKDSYELVEDEISDVEVQPKDCDTLEEKSAVEMQSKDGDVLEEETSDVEVHSKEDELSDKEVQPKDCDMLEEEEISVVEMEPKNCDAIVEKPSNEKAIPDLEAQRKVSDVLEAITSNEEKINDERVEPKVGNVLEAIPNNEEETSDIEEQPGDCDVLEEMQTNKEEISDVEVQQKDRDVLEKMQSNEKSKVEVDQKQCDVLEEVLSKRVEPDSPSTSIAIDIDTQWNLLPSSTQNIKEADISKTPLKSPEAVLQNRTTKTLNISQEKIISLRKTKSLVQPLIEHAPSIDPTRFSLENESKDSDEGSWDSHRVTKKTIRRTFGKEMTSRKSLRTLVMERSAKRQTAINDVTNMQYPNANSTEICMSDTLADRTNARPDLIPVTENIPSPRTKQITLISFLEKIKQNNLEKKQRIEETVRSTIKPPERNTINNIDIYMQKSRAKRVAPGAQPAAKRMPPATKLGVVPEYVSSLPKQFYEDVKYKPPKRFTPPNTSWATKRLYKFLEDKLQPRHGYKARVKAERMVCSLHEFGKSLKRYDAAPRDALVALQQHMASHNIVNTYYDFYQFFHDYLPRDIRNKVIPDVINKLPLPAEGVYAQIPIPETARTKH